jgi:ribose transport system permease protein
MNVDKARARASFAGRISNESFITFFMIGVLVVLFAVACIFVPNFYQPQNIVNLFTSYWYVIILGIGVTFLLITGNFDMSVGGVKIGRAHV